MNRTRIPGLHRRSIAGRIDALESQGCLSASDAASLRAGRLVLLPDVADRMIENVVGVFGLPLAIAPNFRVNGRDCLVPLAVEEPSIVAGLCFAARLALQNGGFDVSLDESLLAGQVHLTGIGDTGAAARQVLAARDELIAAGNRVHPRLVARGGGVRDIEVREFVLDDGDKAIAVHLLVDTCDAMGANAVNAICEALAPQIAALGGGETSMCILSNLADRSIATARVRIRRNDLATRDRSASEVCDAIVKASLIAAADRHRAATHNKGIMNGIDAVAIATGNDWRAIEAGAHAYAAAGDRYRPLSRWSCDEDGMLTGELRLPLKVGIVGGTAAVNPSASLGLRIAGAATAKELGELMAAVGLAQNFAALRALVTGGIQQGHMHLHARSVVAAAGVPRENFDSVVAQLIADGDIKEQRARELAAGLSHDADVPKSHAAGKVILLGEHAVVYGSHALAWPIARAVAADVVRTDAGVSLSIPDWNLSQELCRERQPEDGVDAAVALILQELDVEPCGFAIRVRSNLPRAMGLGSSAALAVAIVRAFDAALCLDLDDARVNAIAFECEKLAHGTPSGLDNILATYSRPMLFTNRPSLAFETVEPGTHPPLVIASSGRPGMTREQVAKVRAGYERNPRQYDAIFTQVDALSLAGADALRCGDYQQLGELMNICHGLLNGIGVATPELESMLAVARSAGASGAKLTGAGGGGSIVAVCPGTVTAVTEALKRAGYWTMSIRQDGEWNFE